GRSRHGGIGSCNSRWDETGITVHFNQSVLKSTESVPGASESAGQTAAARPGIECRACASATAAAAAPADPEALPTATLDFFVPESPPSPTLSDQLLAAARVIRAALERQA